MHQEKKNKTPFNLLFQMGGDFLNLMGRGVGVGRGVCVYIGWYNSSTKFIQFRFPAQMYCTQLRWERSNNTFFVYGAFISCVILFSGFDCFPSVMDAFPSSISACMRERQNLTYPSLSQNTEHSPFGTINPKVTDAPCFPQQDSQLFYSVFSMKLNAVDFRVHLFRWL